MPACVISGTESDAEIRFAQTQLGLEPKDVWILARTSNLLSQSRKYKERVILIRYPGEPRLMQLARLFRCLRRFQHSLYFWRNGRNLFINMMGLGLVTFLAGRGGKVVRDGQIHDLTAYLTFSVRLPWRKIRLIELFAITLAGLFAAGRFVCRRIRGSCERSMRWLKITFRTLSADQVNSFCAESAARYFRYETQLYSENRFERFGAYFKLCHWMVWSMLATIVLYPFIILTKPFKKKPKANRILFVSHESILNGAPRSLLTILENLDRNEFEPFLLSASEGLLTRRVRALQVPVIILPLSQLLTQSPRKRLLLEFVRFIIFLRYLLVLLTTLRIQIVHTNVLVSPDVALAAKLLRITSVWHFREAIGNDAWAKIQVWILDSLSDRIVCNSDYSRQLLNSRGVFCSKTVTVRNAIDVGDFSSMTDRIGLRQNLEVRDGEILVGCVGQITPVKGQEIFVRAAIEVSRRFEHVKFVLVGTMENRDFIDSLSRTISEANLAEKIKFLGYRADIADIIGALDIHVTPSLWAEPFGRVALESMAAGVVSVVSKVGGLPEIVLDQVTGLHVNPGNVDELAATLDRLIGDAELLRRLREAGIRRAREHFSFRRHLDDIEHIYRYPFPTSTRLANSKLWATLQKLLPGRMRSHPKLLIYYPILILAVALFWLVTLTLFIVSFPFATSIGWYNRRSRATPRVRVLAYQTRRNAATRFRITKPFGLLTADGVDVRVDYPSSAGIGDQVYVSLFYGHLPHVKDFYYYIVVFAHRLLSILRSYSDDCVVLQYELFYEGPMWMELLVAYTHPRVIYDYDDSLYAFRRYAKYLPRLLRAVRHVVAGNDYIAEYSRKYNSRVTVIPTCPDHEVFAQRTRDVMTSEGHAIRIGWIGNPANLGYLNIVGNVLRRLSSERRLLFIIISAGPYDLSLLGLDDLPVRRLEWSLDGEAAGIDSFDIGIMPVLKDLVGEGKCGFKALQYMAAGIPCIASPVGVNVDIIQHGVTGYLADTEEEWYQLLKALIDSPELRQTIGQRARQYTLQSYSLQLSARRWSDVLRNVLCDLYVERDLCRPA